MDNKQLDRANELNEIIDVTEEGLDNLKALKCNIRTEKEKRNYDDLCYNLYIGEYSDGSGENRSDLCRYMGNMELLDIIIDTLEKQLKQYKEEFDGI